MNAVERAGSRCWLEVNLDAVAYNYRSAEEMLGGSARIIPVLKANAYGLGAVTIARTLSGLGATLFSVATLEEALEIKKAVPSADVLTMGWLDPSQVKEAIAEGIILTMYSRQSARRISEASAGAGRAARVHIKVDTGLHRLGFDAGDINAMREAAALRGISAEGMFTHLALHSPEADRAQLNALCAAAGAMGVNGLIIHGMDSIGMARYPDYYLSAVRLGAWLYGVCPPLYPNPERCLPTARFMARIAQIRRVAAGERIGYDGRYPLKRDSLIATLTAGYSDGYMRLNSAGEVEICGKRAPVAGLVCMDYAMADVTGIEGAEESGEVALLGGTIGVSEYAAWGGLNRNEATARIGRRVPRVYYSGGKPVNTDEYL
jgi:alanine racemase